MTDTTLAPTDAEIDAAYRKVWSTIPHAQRLSAFAHEIASTLAARWGAPAPAPTDEEIWREWELILATSNPTAGTAAIKLARTAIAKWGGAPAPASGEPVALRYRMHGDLQWQYTENPDQASHADVIQRLATTAQEVRTPLDEWDILQRAAGHSHPGTAGYDIELARFVESAHGITAQKETP